MYELIGQLLAAIFGTISGDKKFRSKYKFALSFFVGLTIFIVCIVSSFFDSSSDKPVIIPALIFSTTMSVLSFFIILIEEYLAKRKLRKQQKNLNGDKDDNEDKMVF